MNPTDNILVRALLKTHKHRVIEVYLEDVWQVSQIKEVVEFNGQWVKMYVPSSDGMRLLPVSKGPPLRTEGPNACCWKWKLRIWL